MAHAFESFEAAWLRGVFLRALNAALASSLGAAACGDGATCDGGANRLALSELKPAEPVDYVNRRFGSRGAPGSFDDLKSGVACSTATDMGACKNKLEEVQMQPLPETNDGNCAQIGCMYLVATRGDDVLRIDRQDDLVEFLGPIDTSADARLLLEWAGYGLCDSTGVEKAAGGFETSASSISNTCPVEGKRVQLQITADGRLKELSSEPLAKSDACVGRRPEGLVSAGTSTETNALAAHFASVAELEAAAVAAFDVIACELEHYGAPPELIAAARAAAADEVRHTRDTARLARRFHGTVRAPLIEPRPVRSLESFAEDNAAEGCVRETFGALFGHYQAATARDPEIAEVMHQIADDETRHAALSHRIARWVEPRLTAAGRKRVASARATALTTLFRELQAEPAPELRALAGVPDAATAKRLLESLVAEFV